MPDHIHLLISEPEKGDPSRVMQAVKQGFSRRVLKRLRKRGLAAQGDLFPAKIEPVWQRRFYDFNVWSARKRREKLRYMHRNPVNRDWYSLRSCGAGAAIGAMLLGKRVGCEPISWEGQS
jgi:putative transposase